MQSTNKRSALLFTYGLLGSLLACSGSATSSSSSGGAIDVTDSDSGITEETDAGVGVDSSKSDKPDAAEPMPTKPVFEITINGVARTVKSLSVTPTNLTGVGGQGIPYYTIDATLDKDQTPLLMAGLQKDPHVFIEVGRDDSGTDICKEVYGPKDGNLTPRTQVREISISYSYFNGSVTRTTSASTLGSGSGCDMNIRVAAKDGKAWGEATGKAQASAAGEPLMTFSTKWFQTVSWSN